MKLSHEVLLYKIWLAQLKNLSGSVLHKYFGGGVSVCRENWYKQASSIHIIERGLITQKIGTQQLRKRIISLIGDGTLIWSHKDCTFMIDTEQAQQAFNSAREFMLSKDVPTGWDEENSCCRKIIVDDLEGLKSECHKHLIENFKQINWSQVYKEVE